MMSFYKRSFHSFLGLTAGGSSVGEMSPEGGEPPPCKCGLGLINSINSPGYDEIYRRGSPHILESSLAGVPLRSPEKRDPGGIGFLDEADSLMLCTECLGFESYDERRVDDEEMTCHAVESRMMTSHAAEEEEETEAAAKRRRKEENVTARERNKTFPPPLSSLDGGGKRCFYLRPVRKDGRLELTGVMIQRPEILRASRENGRLRLHLVDSVINPIRPYNYNFQETIDSEDECDDEECGKDIDTSIMEHHREIDDDDDGDDDGDDDDDNGGDMNISLVHQRETEEDRDSSRRKSDEIADLSVTRYCQENVDHVKLDHENDVVDDDYDDDCGDGCDHCYDDSGDDEEWRYKTCHEVVMSRDHHPCHQYHHNNHNMQLWSQRYVTTR